MLCIFPFEADLYNQSGLRTVFVGHPMIKSLAGAQHRFHAQSKFDRALSRKSPPRSAKDFSDHDCGGVRNFQTSPNAQFEAAAASEVLASEIQQQLLRSSLARDKVRVGVGENSAIMQRACVGIIASGTATLEAAYLRLPFVLVYKVSWLTYVAARLVVRIKYLGMPNVLVDREVVSEFIQHRAKPRAIAKTVLNLMSDPSSRQRMISDFDEVASKLGQGGADRAAARVILDEITSKSLASGGGHASAFPHFFRRYPIWDVRKHVPPEQVFDATRGRK